MSVVSTDTTKAVITRTFLDRGYALAQSLAGDRLFLHVSGFQEKNSFTKLSVDDLVVGDVVKHERGLRLVNVRLADG